MSVAKQFKNKEQSNQGKVYRNRHTHQSQLNVSHDI